MTGTNRGVYKKMRRDARVGNRCISRVKNHGEAGHSDGSARTPPARSWAAKALERFRATTSDRAPRLLPWLTREPHKALALYDDWQRLLDVVDWFETRDPTPVYLQQIDLPGLHSKFIESHRGVLSSLLEII